MDFPGITMTEEVMSIIKNLVKIDYKQAYDKQLFFLDCSNCGKMITLKLHG